MKRRELFMILVGAVPVRIEQAQPAPVDQPSQVTIELDGRTLAELIVPHLPDVIRRQGMY